MKNPILTTSNGIKESFSNLYYGGECSIPAILDVVEDSSTGSELVNKLNKLKLVEKFRLDRETPTYVRLVTTDCFGNQHYFKADKI